MGVVIEELKQRTGIKRYQERVGRFRQNRMSQNNQRQFHRELNHEGERCDYNQPDAEEMKKIWANIWSEVNVTK